MSLDSKKFILTADRKQIRLFPHNYCILSREATDFWAVEIDAAVPEELAVEIFRTVHKDHNVKWGAPQIALDALNNLLPESKGEDTDWELEDVLEGYHIWIRIASGEEIFQCTITNCPPQNKAGYRDRDALLELKGITPSAPGFEQVG